MTAHLYAHRGDPARAETAAEREQARYEEAAGYARVLEEFALFLQDLSPNDEDVSTLHDMRTLTWWMDQAPDAVKQVVTAGITRHRIGRSYAGYPSDEITIMGVRLRAEPSRKGGV